MSYFVLNQDAAAISVADYLAKIEPESAFGRFIRREALGQVSASQSVGKPRYLRYANKLGFNWESSAEAGHVQYDYKANVMRRLVMDYARQLVSEIGLPIYEVSGANMFNLSHPVVDAYASLYGDRLYQFKSGKGDVVLSYDASFPQFNLAGKRPLSYRQLPFAHFSLSDCYRHEQSGELMLLMRQRRFYMPDLHPYFKDMAEAFAWFPRLQEKIMAAQPRGYHVVVEVPSDEIWEQYRGYIEKIPGWLGSDVLINVLNDGNPRYWIVNVDYKILDELGQSREIGCIQVDIGSAGRLGIKYIDAEGRARHPVIVHSAIPGGIERFLYVLFDSFEQGMPLWLAPVQLRLLPVNSELLAECHNLVQRLAHMPLRIEIDNRSLSLSAKIKAAHDDLVPHMAVCGDRERKDGFVGVIELAKKLAEGNENRPFIRRGWPAELSQQLRG